MKQSPQERQHRRQQFRQMTGGKKLEYLWMYYRAPFLVGCLCLILFVSTLRQLAAQKEPVLYLAEVNVATGETLNQVLDGDYVAYSGGNPQKQQVFLYKNLYLSDNAATENHEYAYASSMKLMAAINARELDMVLMNREAYDLCSRSGYLAELTGIIPASLTSELEENEVTLEDNSLDVALGNDAVSHTVTQRAANALRVNQLSLFSFAGFPEEVYFGIIANTPRMDACIRYLSYLAQP